MNCANHSDAVAVAYCRTCGKPLCNACSRNVGGVVYCETCVAKATPAPGNGAGVPPPIHANPALAGFLGLIPGVGAMYNGQFMKGLFNVGVFVVMVWVADHFGPIMVPVFFAYFFYSVFDAYKTALAIQHGLPLPDPFGLEAMFGQGMNQTAWPHPTAPPQTPVAGSPMPGGAPWNAGQQEVSTAQEGTGAQDCGGGLPIGAVILIGLGCLFLLKNLGWFWFSMDRFWPVILIVIGVWLFFKRWTRRVS